MKVFKSITILCLLGLAAYLSIASGDEKFDPVPELSFKGIVGDSIMHLQPELVLDIGYFDGDGDLGENNIDVYNLFVTDSRNDVTYKFRIQQLRDDQYTCAIQGNMQVVIPRPGIIDKSTTEEVLTYSIYTIDRSGNQSQTVATPPLTIYR